jgi:hypothetical protein
MLPCSAKEKTSWLASAANAMAAAARGAMRSRRIPKIAAAASPAQSARNGW